MDAYKVIGDNPLGSKAYDVLAPFVGEQFGLEGISAAADALEVAFNKAGFSFHRVNIPPQELMSGFVTLEILRFHIGEVQISGNEYYDIGNIRRSVPNLESKQTPNTIALSEAVKWANKNASKKLVLRFKESEEPNAINAELNVSDRDPQMFFVSLDNSGGYNSESARMTLGYQNGNVLNKDHSMTLTVTTAPKDTDLATQFGLSYQIPYYSNLSRLNLLFSDSESNSGTVADNNLVTGKGSVLGATYTKTYFSTNNLEHNVSVGFMYKLFDNEIVGTTSKVLSFPLELSYGLLYSGSQSLLTANFSLASNMESGDDNNDATYGYARSGATSEWSASRYRFSWDYAFIQNWMIHADLSGQITNNILIPGELFGVGGSSTLRGFEERYINGDEGVRTRVELWGPSFYQVRWLVFADNAHIENNNGAISDDVASLGLGFRWSWKTDLNLSLDIGRITDSGDSDTTVNKKDDTKTHFSLVYRF
ncbi:MAG: ShlB/FhaC/HecB family hemolysin secretion/activation protein [Gammaproteobacteria bacterium]|nr:ShlB/FhaC/HecB family hemolysin secretion/activation protein [Gammaproteobacteria bacterium]